MPVASLIVRWLESRLGFAMRLREGRTSLTAALILLLRLGLPVTVLPSGGSLDDPVEFIVPMDRE